MLLFGNVQNDSRVKRSISALSRFHVNLLCRDYKNQDICPNAHFYHNRYTDRDKNQFEPKAGLIVKFIKKLNYYITTEKIKIKNAVKIKTDIYYCNDFNTLISGFTASRKKKTKLIYDTHELWADRSRAKRTGFNKLKQFWEYLIEWFLIRRCDLVITVSDGIADELIKRYHIKKPLVIRNLDTKKELPSEGKIRNMRSSLDIPEDCTLIVYQGGLSDARGIPELIESFKLLPEEYHLLLMGNHISKTSKENLENCNRIHYLGMIDEHKLFQYTSMGDIGIAPIISTDTLSYSLAFPNKFSQYMNAGLALVLYRSPESEKIISQCNCGLILEAISAEEIAKSIIEISEKNKFTSLKENARQCFLKYYNWDVDKQKLKEIISRL